MDDLGEGFRLTAHIDGSVSAERVCALMHRTLESLVETLAEDPSLPAYTLKVLPDAERRQLLETFNDTAQAYPQEALIHQLFEAQVAQRGDATALVFEERSLSYAEVNRRANQLAHYLREQGVGPDTFWWACAWSAHWRW